MQVNIHQAKTHLSRLWQRVVAGEEVTLREGEVLHIPSNVLHQVEALDDTFVLGVFSPVRQDWAPVAGHE